MTANLADQACHFHTGRAATDDQHILAGEAVKRSVFDTVGAERPADCVQLTGYVAEAADPSRKNYAVGTYGLAIR
jgi:hypothetical protein